jgi:putative transposase
MLVVRLARFRIAAYRRSAEHRSALHLRMDLTYYQRNLPHILPPGETIFVTFRLAGSLPAETIARWQEEQRLHELGLAEAPRFSKFDGWLDQPSAASPDWLRYPAVAAIVKEAMHYRDGAAYQLWSYCLMPNHVHLLASVPASGPPFAKTLQSLKSNTARRCNDVLQRGGAFWQRESYDRVMRDGAETSAVVTYILNNPVKARLAADWQQWPHSYLHPALL